MVAIASTFTKPPTFDRTGEVPAIGARMTLSARLWRAGAAEASASCSSAWADCLWEGTTSAERRFSSPRIIS